jgi:pimeloyl-ACP methyl ester carboxylesterase
VSEALNKTFTRYTVQCATPSGLHNMSYLEWGRRDNPHVLVCAHGLTRCGRDFDFLARALCNDYRVICPDVAGRGESDWLANPMEYAIPVYLADMVTLIARLDVGAVDWLGTSMGGLIGMTLAALPNSPIRKLVLNDAGPHITAVSLDRIGEYVGKAPILPSIEMAEMLMRTVSAPFGLHSDAEWRFLTEHMVKTQANGSVVFRYDPAIAVAFNADLPHKDIDLWPVFDSIRCPTLVLRGAESDLLTPATAHAMTERGPRAKLAEFPGVGHAPTLIHDDQIGVVRDFLR